MTSTDSRKLSEHPGREREIERQREGWNQNSIVSLVLRQIHRHRVPFPIPPARFSSGFTSFLPSVLVSPRRRPSTLHLHSTSDLVSRDSQPWQTLIPQATKDEAPRRTIIKITSERILLGRRSSARLSYSNVDVSSREQLGLSTEQREQPAGGCIVETDGRAVDVTGESNKGQFGESSSEE